ncbi:hypothetical protein G15_0371 [Enterococcus avium]|nr:hypothetical protein G15_0371 [Enterococcus avium]
MKKSLLTSKEFEVLNIFWASDDGLTAKQIHDTNPDLVLSTVQSAIKNLIKKDMLRVDDIVYSGTVLTRSYVPTLSEESFVLQQYESLNIPELLTQFLGESKDTSKEIETIERILAEKRRDL